MCSQHFLSLTFQHYPSRIFPKDKCMGTHRDASPGCVPSDVPFCLQLCLCRAKDPDAKKQNVH